MQCERCGLTLEEDQANNFEGKMLCEDCCFDLMNPPKTCDPLAVSATLTIRKELGQTGTDGLSGLQKNIFNAVVERGKLSREEVMELFDLTPEELERQFAVLRHCELLRSFKEGDTVYLAKF